MPKGIHKTVEQRALERKAVEEQIAINKANRDYSWMKGVVGRKPKFATKETLVKAINSYFKETPFNEVTVSGLAIGCGTNRMTMDNYQKKPEFKEIITMAKALIENSYELSLRKNGRSGDIFALKQFGWQDIVISDNRHSGKVDTGINWVESANIMQDKAINVMPHQESPIAITQGEDDGEGTD